MSKDYIQILVSDKLSKVCVQILVSKVVLRWPGIAVAAVVMIGGTEILQPGAPSGAGTSRRPSQGPL